MNMATLALALLFGATPPNLPEAIPINDRSIRIPIKLAAAAKPHIRELKLFYSTDQGKTWAQASVAPPDQEEFKFTALIDGIYWFAVSVTDMSGHQDPADMSSATVSQVVLVDTLKPLIRIATAERKGDEVFISWEIQEENPDLKSLTLEYRTADNPSGWIKAPISPNLKGTAQFRPYGNSPISVRLLMTDTAGNVGTTSTDILSPAFANAQLPVNPSTSNPPPPVPPASAAPNWNVPKTPPYPPAAGISETRYVGNSPPMAPGTSNYQLANSTSADQSGRPLAMAEAAASRGSVVNANLTRASDAPSLIVNTKQINLDYEITRPPASGIGKIELWMTRDDGQNWTLATEDSGNKNYIPVEVPAEGSYGFCLIVKNSHGLSKRTAPVKGEVPEIRVEVDLTPPVAELWQPEADPRSGNTLFLHWNATDRNIAPLPVTLQWAERPGEGTWQMIANDLPASGRFPWKLPANVPNRVYLRLIAKDSAGNTFVTETKEPVVIDLPEGHLVGINGLARLSK